MKFFITVLFVLTSLLSKSQPTQNEKSLASIHTSCGDISNNHRKVSFFGQVYSSFNNERNTIIKGMLLPVIIYTLTINKKEEEIEVIAYPNPTVTPNDVGNIIACIYPSPLTITSGFSTMQVDRIINLEEHDTFMTDYGPSGGIGRIGNDEIYTSGIIEKIVNDSYIIL